MKRLGRQTWQFENRPRIIGKSAVVGPEEGEGPLSSDFDYVYDNLEIGEKTWEKGERKLLEQASQLALINANITKEELQFFVGGDLMNQIISSSFSARKLGVPYLGVFGACSTSMETLALASMIVDSGAWRLCSCRNGEPQLYGGETISVSDGVWLTEAALCAIYRHRSRVWCGLPNG